MFAFYFNQNTFVPDSFVDDKGVEKDEGSVEK
jgi:hypothetical protein